MVIWQTPSQTVHVVYEWPLSIKQSKSATVCDVLFYVVCPNQQIEMFCFKKFQTFSEKFQLLLNRKWELEERILEF